MKSKSIHLCFDSGGVVKPSVVGPRRTFTMAFPEFPTNDDVRSLLRSQYGDDEREAVLELLGPVNTSGVCVGWHAARIQLAALAMSGGNKSLIRQWIDLGNTDARDLQMAVHSHLGPTWDRECLVNIDR